MWTYMAEKCWKTFNGIKQHEFKSLGMWGTGIKVGQKCFCGETEWTKADRESNWEAIDQAAETARTRI